MSPARWLLYGANGYTGRLIAEEAVDRGLAPVLAGRREAAIRPLAERMGLPWRVFGLDDPKALDRGLGETDAIVLAAGPFSATSRPVVEACLRRGIHYLDITGEIDILETVYRRDTEAREATVALLPAVGFDVVPTDCLAASLASALPGAARLDLAFAGSSGPSAGTAKSALEGLARGGAVRRGGEIARVPVAWRTREVPFRDRTRLAVTIPWGDLASAGRSTGIPDVTTWMAMPPRAIRVLRLVRPFLGAFRIGLVRRMVGRVIDARMEGPDRRTRETARSYVWGRVETPDGRSLEGTVETPEAYAFTAMAAVESVVRLLADPGSGGARTPSQAFGAGYVTELEGCDLVLDSRS